jgi:hypothetical protein
MTALAMLTVFDGRELCGFVLKRGRAGFDAFNRDEASLGIRRPPPQCGFRQCGKGLREGGLLMLEQLATDLTPPSAAVFTEAEAQRRLAEHGKASVLELARVWGWSASAVYRFLQSKHRVKHQVKQMAVFQVKRIWSFRLFRRSDAVACLGLWRSSPMTATTLS